jgi:hypothetical protein
MGADQSGSVHFLAALAGTNSGLTSGGLPILYSIDSTTGVLTGATDAGDVFTITLNPNADNLGTDQYTVNMIGTVDGGISSIDFNAGGYDFVGGNASWAGFNTADKKGVNIDDNSQDLLLTPMADGATVNTTASEGGIDNTSIGSGQGMRVDFVTDLAGSPDNGQPYVAATATHTFDGHYNVNGALAKFTSTGGSAILIKAFDDSDLNTPDDGDPNTLVGDGIQDSITAIGITYGGETKLVSFATIGTDVTNVLVGTQTFTVQFMDNLEVSGIQYEVLVGSVVSETSISVFTADGYTSVEYGWAGGDTFQIGDFGTSVIESGVPVEFQVPVEIVDGDGDTAPGTIDVLLLPEDTIYNPDDAMSGTSGDDTIDGDTNDNLIYGGDGDDTIDGGAGADAIYGGDGDDAIVFDAADSHVDGGAGIDTLLVADTETTTPLDFSHITNIETLHLNADNVDQHVTLSLDQVLDMTGDGNLTTVAGVDVPTLTIAGEGGDDVVTLTGIDGIGTGGDWDHDGGGLFTNNVTDAQIMIINDSANQVAFVDDDGDSIVI